MTLTIEREPLTAALSAISRLATNKSWETVRLSSAAGHLHLCGTDGEHWLYLAVPCSGELATVCVHAQRLHDVIAALPGELVGFQIEGSDLKLAAGKGRRSLRLASSEFPEREFDGEAAITIDAAPLREALAFTVPSIAEQSDPTKWQWAGVRFETFGGKLKLFGTDKHNLAIADLCDCTAEVGATITPKASEAVSRLIHGDVEIRFTARAAQFAWDGGKLIGPLIDGPWIPLDQLFGLVDGETDLSFTVEAKELLGAVRSVRPIGFFDRGSRSTGIKLTLNGSAKLSTEAAEGSTEQEFNVDYEGDEFTTGFAAARMERVLTGFGDAVLSVGVLKRAQGAMRFDAAARPDRIALLYPMKI